MPKYLVQCENCGNKFTTRKTSFKKRVCPACHVESDFEIVEKKPLMNKKKNFDIMCLRCRSVHHVQTIPKQCGCGQRFQQHAENTTLTDVIYNAIIGSDKEKKGYMKVTIARDGMVWWTPEKDEFGDDTDPFIGDSSCIGQSSYQGQIDSMRTDDLRPIYRKSNITTVRKKDYRS